MAKVVKLSEKEIAEKQKGLQNIFAAGREIAAAIAEYNRLKPGDLCEDGSIYIGFFDDQDWYAMAADAKDIEGNWLTLNFNEAAKYGETLRACNRDDWKIPPKQILDEVVRLKNVGAFAGSFNAQEGVAAWHWSSSDAGATLDENGTHFRYHARRLDAGVADGKIREDIAASVRYVRAEKRKGAAAPLRNVA